MKNKKHIDKFFGEDFKNFEAAPSPQVWENIQKELNKEKRERKVIPLWIKYGGIAALLALLLTVGNFIYNPSDGIQNSITNETIVNPEIETPHTNNDTVNYESKEPSVASENTVKVAESIDKSRASEKELIKNSKGKSDAPTSQNAVVANTSQKNTIQEKEIKESFINKKDDQNINAERGLANSKQGNNLDSKDNEGRETVKNQIIDNHNIVSSETKEKFAVSDKSEIKNLDSTDIELVDSSKNQKSLLEAIAEKNKEEDKSLKEENQKPENRWIVTPNVAPVYYSSLGNGSSISPDFTNNPQQGDVNMSYGLQVSYALSERLSIRSGINNMDLSYSTSDIVIGTGPVSAALKSVDYGSRQIVVTAISRQSFNSSQNTNDFGEITLKSTSGDARLIQNINYYEIPVELKYAVVDSKLGINLIGGVSTLFLGNNEISVKSDNFSSVLGEANNLSSVSFSTNIGLGLDYKLSKRFAFNVEPMFKYQLNPYTDSTVNFKPYYLGVYSGLSFKF